LQRAIELIAPTHLTHKTVILRSPPLTLIPTLLTHSHMQRAIEVIAPTLQYSVIPSYIGNGSDGTVWRSPFRDANDVIIERILDRKVDTDTCILYFIAAKPPLFIDEGIIERTLVST
jgi:hypothetical protein